MNRNQRNLYKRLLRLFPVRNLLEYFELTGSQEDVIDSITGSNRPEVIHEYILENYLYTKQHIYLLDSPGTTLNIDEDLPYGIIATKETPEKTLLLLPEIIYRVFLQDPSEVQELPFLQPVIIRQRPDALIIHITKIERTVNRDFESDRNPIKAGAIITEEEVKQNIISHFTDNLGLEKIDLNRGVKNLWDNDIVDGMKIQHRDPNSVTQTTMDEEYLYKEQYPEKYSEIIQGPLMKMQFRYLVDDLELCNHFEIDAGNGIINIPTFPKNINQVNNVVREILTNN